MVPLHITPPGYVVDQQSLIDDEDVPYFTDAGEQIEFLSDRERATPEVVIRLPECVRKRLPQLSKDELLRRMCSGETVLRLTDVVNYEGSTVTCIQRNNLQVSATGLTDLRVTITSGA